MIFAASYKLLVSGALKIQCIYYRKSLLVLVIDITNNRTERLGSVVFLDNIDFYKCQQN